MFRHVPSVCAPPLRSASGQRSGFHREKGKKTKQNSKQKAAEYCQNTHTHTPSHTRKYTETSPVNFCFSRGQIQPCGFVCSFGNQTGPKKGKNKVKRITNLFSSLSPDMNYSLKPCECFRRKYFLWMCLRGSAQCKKKTKVGAVYFLHSRVY